MNYVVLDTNAYVALDRGDAFVAEVARASDQIIMPNIVIGELYYGFINGSKTQINIKKLDAFLSTPRVSVLYPDSQTSFIFGEISTELARAGKSIQQNDIWIAALCKQHGYPLLTYDKGFKNVLGLKLNTIHP
jgi:tRNA(fMet)-specific endonuclease VapC